MPREPRHDPLNRYRWSSNRAHGPDGTTRPTLLLICDYRPREASTVLEHIEAIRRYSRYDVFVLPIHGDLPDELDLAAFDGLLIHYNVVMSVDAYLSPLARWRIARFTGTKGAFIQDEYRFVDRTVAVLRTMGINVLFTCVPQDQVPLVYDPSRLPDLRRTVTVLTGYVPVGLLARPTVPWDERPVDVVYRARRLAPWLGRLGQEKAGIADRFLADAPAHGLRVDISTEEADRIYGERWVAFLEHAKATLGVESGASVFDFDGSVEQRTRAYLAAHPNAGYEEVHRAVLADVEGRIRLNQISPRSFEAAALGTLMVLYPGAYSGILEPWRHYVPLEKDHRNMAEVVAAIRDRATWERITGHARAEVAENPEYSFEAMTRAMDDGLDLTPAPHSRPSGSAFERIAERSYRRLPAIRAHAWGLPRRVNRLRLVPRQIADRIVPHPTAILVIAPEHEHRWIWRRRIRVARAGAFWAARPRTLPWSLILAHGRPLLEELSRLARLQSHGARANRAGAGSPFCIRLDEATGTLSIGDATAGTSDAGDLPSDLGWVTNVRLDLTNPWLVPPGLGAMQDRFVALADVFRDRPDVGRRLLRGSEPWAAVASAIAPPPPPPGDGGGA